MLCPSELTHLMLISFSEERFTHRTVALFPRVRSVKLAAKSSGTMDVYFTALKKKVYGLPSKHRAKEPVIGSLLLPLIDAVQLYTPVSLDET